MVTLPRAVAVIVVGVLLSASQPGNAQAPDPARDHAGEAFVIERSRTVYWFDNDGTGRRDAELRVRVQTDAGLQHWGQLVFGYNAATERLDIRFVRVHKADGSIVTAPPDAVQDLTSPVQRDAPVYTDFRQKHVTVPSLRPGETLEISLSTDIHTPLAEGHFWLEYDFETIGVVLDEQLEIDIPRDRPVILRTAEDADPVVADVEGRRIYRWARAQTRPTEEVLRDLADDDDEPAPAAVRLTTFQSWEDVGRWYSALESPARTVTPEIRAQALALTAGKTTDPEKLEAIYDFVAPGFRYVSISLGLGRYQPRRAADVLRDQYGDCKDKHTLLVSLLESIGLRASTVLIHSEAPLDPEFPSPSQFDHVITRADVDGQDVWLDVTPEVAPFRLLSPSLRHKQALIVTGGSGRLEETPADTPHGNALSQDIEGVLARSGTLTARVRLTVRGDLELWLRSVFHQTPAAGWRDIINGVNGAAGVGGEVDNVRVSSPLATKEPLVIEYQVTRTRFVDVARRTASMRLPWSETDLPAHDGTTPLDLGTALAVTYRLQLDVDEGLDARAPVPVSIARDYGTYDAGYRLDGRRFTAERTLQLTARSIAPERATDYAAFRRVVTADAAQTLSLDVRAAATTAADATLTADDLLRAGLDAMRAGNAAQAVPPLTRLVELEPRHQTAWTVLGMAHATMGRLDAALDAFTRQIELDPFHDYAHAGAGAIYLSQRRYADAEAAFLRQLEVNPLDRQTPPMLGQLYLRMERYAHAAAQFERAVAIAPEDASLQVERGRAYLHLGRHDEALAAFDRAVAISSTAVIWNNLAYYLAEARAHLDRAQQYAESAVAATAATSRSFALDRITDRELGVVRSLAAYWDTLGWVAFARGDLDRAERLLGASWHLGQHAVMGDHLAQVYEQQGRRDVAMRTYAAALSTDRPDPSIRERLLALAGSDDRVAALVQEHAGDLADMRTLRIGPGPIAGTAEVFVLVGTTGIEDVSFIGGDDLQGMRDAILAADVGAQLPEPPARVLRRGVLECSASAGEPSCSLVLFRSGDARPPAAQP